MTEPRTDAKIPRSDFLNAEVICEVQVRYISSSESGSRKR